MGGPSGPLHLILLYYIMKFEEIKKREESWEVKDRTYRLTVGSPLTWTIQTKHTRKKPLLWFDEENGFNREIRYATNQKSIFTDEQDGYVTLGHVIFEDGMLFVPRSQQPLQKLLSLYHPKADNQWKEIDSDKKAQDTVANMETVLDALNLVTELEEDHLIAVLRTEHGSAVTGWTPAQLKRMGFAMANKNPKLFVELANDDEIQLRNTAVMATEAGIVKLINNNTQFTTTSGKKLFTVPFDENPYQAFARYFKTDEGVDVLKSIEKKLK